MRRNNWFVLVAAAAASCGLLLSHAASAQTVVELFQKAKSQVKLGSYEDALKTLDALDKATASPGHEAERKQVEPPIAFYRGVSFAALGRKDEAQASFRKYLGFVPNASMDASMSRSPTSATSSAACASCGVSHAFSSSRFRAMEIS